MKRHRHVRKARLCSLGVYLIMTGALAQAPACEMTFAFWQADKDARGGRTAVWTDAAGNLMFIEKLNVNTDGTRRSYSVADFWGETRAINNLCNAMSDACAGLTRDQLRERRIATQDAAKAGWPAEKLKAVRLSPSIIPMPGGKPCPEVDGYLVSATSLRVPRVTDACAIENYVGDSGPVGSLGEATVAMNRLLLGKQGDPVNYKDARRWVAPPTFVLVFAGSRDLQEPYMTTARIDAAASRRFEDWGGVPRARACVFDYRTRHSG